MIYVRRGGRLWAGLEQRGFDDWIDQRSVQATCDECLNGGKCGVCLGHGRIQVAPNSYDSCHRCAGTGACRSCNRRPAFRLDG